MLNGNIFVTPPKAAMLADVPVRTIRDWIKKKRLVAYWKDNRWLVKVSEVMELAARRQNNGRLNKRIRVPAEQVIATLDTDKGSPCIGDPWCGNPSVYNCPVALCVRHLARVLEFINETQVNVRRELTAELRRAAASSVMGTIYYLKVDQLIKIGYSGSLQDRIIAYPPHAQLLATEPGSFVLERRRHQQFAHLLDQRKEWFRPGQDLLDHIAGLA